MLKRVLTTLAFIAAFSFANSAAWSEPKDIRWGTGPVGSSGHKALVVLANILNKEMPDYRISVLPLPGRRVRGFLRLRHCARGVRHRLRSLQRIQGKDEASAGAIVLGLHARGGARDQGEQPGQDQEMGRSHRPKSLYGSVAVRHAPQARARAGRGWRQAQLHASRPVDGGLATGIGRDRRHDHLYGE
jgi:hypothetical protein